MKAKLSIKASGEMKETAKVAAQKSGRISSGRSAESYAESREPVPRILALLDILRKFSTDRRGLTRNEILVHGYPPVSSKTFARDIKQLGDWVVRRGHQYFFTGHSLGQEDLILLADLSRSSRMLTDARASLLVAGLKESLAPEDAKLLDGGAVRPAVSHQESGDTLAWMQEIRAAIFARKQIAFRYFSYSLDKGSRKALYQGGALIKGTPLCLVVDNSSYILEFYLPGEKTVSSFRVDRMSGVYLTDDAAESNKITRSFDACAAMHDAAPLGAMLDAPHGAMRGENVVLQFDEAAMDGIVDRFGEEFAYSRIKRKGDVAELAVGLDFDAAACAESPAGACAALGSASSAMFYSWVAGFAGHMRIMKPKDVLEGYQRFLRSLLASSADANDNKSTHTMGISESQRGIEFSVLKGYGEQRNAGKEVSEMKDTLDSFKMLGAALGARLGKKVTVGFPGLDGAPTLGDALLSEPIEDEWPADEIHIYVTPPEELFGISGEQTIPEALGYSRLAAAVVELASARIPPAVTSLSFDGVPSSGPGAVIWMIEGESPDEVLRRKTLVARVDERTCPGMRDGIAGGPAGEGYQHVKDFLMELLANKRVVDGVSCMVEITDASSHSLDYNACKPMAH